MTIKRPSRFSADPVHRSPTARDPRDYSDVPRERELTEQELDRSGFPRERPPRRNEQRHRSRFGWLSDRTHAARSAGDRSAPANGPLPAVAEPVCRIRVDTLHPFPDHIDDANASVSGEVKPATTGQPVVPAVPIQQASRLPTGMTPSLLAAIEFMEENKPKRAGVSAQAAVDVPSERIQVPDSSPAESADCGEIVRVINEFQVGIDPIRLELFRRLGGGAARRSTEVQLRGGKSISGWRVGSMLISTSTTIGGADPLPRFGRALSRTLFAIHLAVMSGKRLGVYVASDWFAQMIWGVQRPKHWRGDLRRVMRDVGRLAVVERQEGQADRVLVPLLAKVLEHDAGWRVQVRRSFLGALATGVQQDGSIRLVRRHLKPTAKVSEPERQAVIATDRKVYGALSRSELNRVIRDRRAQVAATSASCQDLARKKRYEQILVPAYLGEPCDVGTYGPLAAMLYRERSRCQPVKAGKVPAYSGPATIVCPHLALDKDYVAFAANGTRLGRGYKVSTWAATYERYSGRCVDAHQFLELLSTSVEPLGLVVAAIGRSDRWYGLEELRAAPANVLDQVHLRLYTTHEDWITRWCAVFGWAPLQKTSPDQQRVARGTELAELTPLIRERGAAVVARAVGVDASNLSKALAGKRSLSAGMIARLRTHILGSFPSGGTGPGTIFGGCTTMLDHALAYHRLGWAVVPMMRPKGPQKKPLVAYSKFYRQRPSEDQVREWWDRWPDAGIAVVLGPQSGIMAVDVDGKEAYDIFIEKLGAEPIAPKSMSGSGDPYRMHFLFRHPDVATSPKYEPWGKGLEFRGHKGLLVLPPSPHRSGNRYAWVEGHSIEDIALLPVPEPIVRELQNHVEGKAVKSKPAGATPQARRSRRGCTFPGLGKVSPDTLAFLQGMYRNDQGHRNDHLFAAACDLHARGYPIEETEPLLLAGLDIDDDRDRAGWVRSIASAYSEDRRPG